MTPAERVRKFHPRRSAKTFGEARGPSWAAFKLIVEWRRHSIPEEPLSVLGRSTEASSGSPVE